MSEATKQRLSEARARSVLYVRPTHDVSVEPVDDDLTAIMEKAYSQGEAGRPVRGRHKCACGENSRNYDVKLRGGHATNSLCVHYLRYHRDEVPEEELEKVRSLEDYLR